MIVFCEFFKSKHSFCVEPMEFPCRLNVGDVISFIDIIKLPSAFHDERWEVRDCSFLQHGSKMNQFVHLIIKP